MEGSERIAGWRGGRLWRDSRVDGRKALEGSRLEGVEGFEGIAGWRGERLWRESRVERWKALDG